MHRLESDGAVYLVEGTIAPLGIAGAACNALSFRELARWCPTGILFGEAIPDKLHRLKGVAPTRAA